MIRKIKNFIFGLVVRKMSVAAERTFWLIMELAVQFKLLMVTILVRWGLLVGLAGRNIARIPCYGGICYY